MEQLLTLVDYFKDNPALVVLILFTCILFFAPIAEEFVLLTGGFLAAHNPGSWPLTWLCCLFGVVGTDYWAFWLARRFGPPLLRRPLLAHLVSPARLVKAQALITARGPVIVFIMRFIPGGLRIPTFMLCGLGGVSPWRFLLYSTAGAALWLNLAFWLGYALAENRRTVGDVARTFEATGAIVTLTLAGTALLVALAVLAYRLYRKAHPPS